MVRKAHPAAGPGEIPGQPGKTGKIAGKNAAGGLAAFCGKRVDPLSECFVTPGVEVYTAKGDSVGKIINRTVAAVFSLPLKCWKEITMDDFDKIDNLGLIENCLLHLQFELLLRPQNCSHHEHQNL